MPSSPSSKTKALKKEAAHGLFSRWRSMLVQIVLVVTALMAFWMIYGPSREDVERHRMTEEVLRLTPHHADWVRCKKDPLRRIPMSMVGDGVCDCCDGSDESPKTVAVPCNDTCLTFWQRRLQLFERWQTVAHTGNEEFHRRLKVEKDTLISALRRNYSSSMAQLERLTAKLRRAESDIVDVLNDEKEFMKAAADLEKLRRHVKEVASRVRPLQSALSTQPLGVPFATLLDQCWNLTRDEKQFRGGSAEPEHFNFTFQICPYRSVVQIKLEDADPQPKGQLGEKEKVVPPAPTLLGTFDHIVNFTAEKEPLHGVNVIPRAYFGTIPESLEDAAVSSYTHALASSSRHVLRFEGGAPCWQGPERVVDVAFHCGVEERPIEVVENGKCIYFVDFASPSACTDAHVAAAMKDVRLAQLMVNTFLPTPTAT